MFRVVTPVHLAVRVEVDLLLKLLQGVLRAVGQRMQAVVDGIGWERVAHHRRRGEGVVGRETVQWVGKHREGVGVVESAWCRRGDNKR